MTNIDSTENCINQLLDHAPELRAMYDEHIHDYNELLPHVFMGDISRFVVQKAKLGDEDAISLVRRILDCLEQCMESGADNVKDLISVSFVENVVDHYEALPALRGMIGPTLEKEFQNHRK